MNNPRFVASDMLVEAAQRHGIRLSLLVAETAIWVHPDFHLKILRKNGVAAMFPNVRRVRVGQGEVRGQIIAGIRLDDNSYANVAIKRALGVHRSEIKGFETCHVWPRTCYDQRFHTAISNLVLLPRALAGLSDHDAEIQAVLQFRSFELYGWHPETFPPPMKPESYPDCWRHPEPMPDRRSHQARVQSTKRFGNESGTMSPQELQFVIKRILRWASKPHLKVHRILGIVVRSGNVISRADLVAQINATIDSKNAYGAVANLLRSDGNAYGRALHESNGLIRLHPAVLHLVRSLNWS